MSTHSLARRRAALGALAVALAFGLLVATPGTAHAAKRVGMVQAVGVTSTSVTLTWPRFKRAKSYRVHRATNYAMTKGVRVKRTKKLRVTVRRLRPGVEYCFKVRAYNRKGKHIATSARTCKPTAAAPLPSRGVRVSVLTYNVCSKVCDNRADLASKGMKAWAVRRGTVTGTILRSGADVVALQESSGWKTVVQDLGSAYDVVPEMGRYAYSSLVFKRSRFTLVTDRITHDDPTSQQPYVEHRPRSATISLPNGRLATWAELRDRRTGKSTIFVSAHLSDQTTKAANRRRQLETTSLIRQVDSVNTQRVRVVHLGDFNSNKSRGHAKDQPARVMGSHGYVDAYDQARRLTRPNFNSATHGALKPVTSYTYGDHVDKVWIRRGDGIGVLSWANINPMRGKKYAGPLGSDHCPILVNLRMS